MAESRSCSGPDTRSNGTVSVRASPPSPTSRDAAELLQTPFPLDRPGRTIDEALLPAEERPDPPKAILTVVWDGGGWDVLNTWPDAWPFMRKLMEEETLIENAIVGSSPSVTPAVHATIGTGTFPKEHTIVDIPWRQDADNVVGAFAQKTPDHLAVPLRGM